MGTQNVSLPVVAGGLGASTNVGVLEAKKTLIIEGIAGAITVEASGDGVNFCSVASFSGAKTDAVIEHVAQYMRVNATGGSANNVQVVAERGLNRFIALPAPPVNGPGASVDVSEFGCLTTITAATLSGNVGVEISADDVNFSTAFKTFTGPGCYTEDISAKFIRAVGKGGTGDLFVGSQEPSISGITEPATVLLYSPNNPLGDGGNRYTSFFDLYEVVKATRSQGIRRIQVDMRFGSISTPSGPSEPFPAGSATNGAEWDANRGQWVWDWSSILWVNAQNVGGTNPEGSSPTITFDDLCFNINWNTVNFETAYLYQRALQTNSPLIGSMIAEALECNFYAEVGSVPLIIADTTKNFFGLVLFNNCQLGTFNDVAGVSPAPLVDRAGMLSVWGNPGGGTADDVWTDSVGGGFTFTTSAVGLRGAHHWVQSGLPAGTWVFSAVFLAVHGGTWREMTGPFTADATAKFNDIVLVDAITIGAFNLQFPTAIVAAGEVITVIGDWVGANLVTMVPVGAETIDSPTIAAGERKSWAPNSSGRWVQVA